MAQRLNYTKGDPVDQIMEQTGGEGVDAAIEAFGFPQTFEAAIRVTKPGGRISTGAGASEWQRKAKSPHRPHNQQKVVTRRGWAAQTMARVIEGLLAIDLL